MSRRYLLLLCISVFKILGADRAQMRTLFSLLYMIAYGLRLQSSMSRTLSALSIVEQQRRIAWEALNMIVHGATSQLMRLVPQATNCLCKDAELQCRFEPCGHCICQSCYLQRSSIKNCHICGAKIANFTRALAFEVQLKRPAGMVAQ
jgi:hypothetical protein